MNSIKHSGLGIASFIISLIAGLALLGLFTAAGVLETTTQGGLDEESVAALVIGLGILFAGLTTLVSLLLGIIGLVQQERKKIFALLGTIFSGLVVTLAILIVAMGLMMS